MTMRPLVVALVLAFALVSRARVARADDVAPQKPDAGSKADQAPAVDHAHKGGADAPNAAEAKKQFEAGDVAREEGRWVDAANAYSKSLDADEGNYLAHLRYQEAVTEAGGAAALVQSYDETVKERGATDKSAKLHRMRLDPAASRVAALAAL